MHFHYRRVIPALSVVVLLAFMSVLLAQAPQGDGRAAGPGARSGGGGQGRGARGPDPLVLEDRAGFEPIFDGRSLQGWDGDPALWRVEGGAIVGESTAEKVVKENTFLIWRGGEPRDFELKLEFRINSTNSGVQVRSVVLPQGGDIAGKWVMKGYQADIDFNNNFTGAMYEERGRGFLARRGQVIYLGADAARPRIIGNLERAADELKASIKTNDWNQLHIIARGRTLMNILNGQVTAIVIDDDTTLGAAGGSIGLQMHVGAPMKVEFRNIAVRRL